MPDQLADMELDEQDRDVLAVLAEGRSNPYHIRERVGVDKGECNTILVRLGRYGFVEQVDRGLYKITDKGRAEIGVDHDPDERAADEMLFELREELEEKEAELQDCREQLEDARAGQADASEVPDHGRLQDALSAAQRAEKEIPDDTPGIGSVRDVVTILEGEVGEDG